MCEALEKREPLLPPFVRADARMGFVHNHEVGAGSGESFPPLFGLDVVETDHRIGKGIEERLGDW